MYVRKLIRKEREEVNWRLGKGYLLSQFVKEKRARMDVVIKERLVRGICQGN